MQVRKFAATLSTALFLGAVGVTQAVAVTPAAAAPAGSVQASDFRDFTRGYAKGYRDGWREARTECQKPVKLLYKLNDKESDYMRGYDKGFERGFEKGFFEYCD
jgi:hypothetical protein